MPLGEYEGLDGVRVSGLWLRQDRLYMPTQPTAAPVSKLLSFFRVPQVLGRVIKVLEVEEQGGGGGRPATR